MIDWVSSLEAWGRRTALNINGVSVSYASLHEKIELAQSRLRVLLREMMVPASPDKNTRPLVLLELQNSLSGVVWYLSCLRAGWPVILVSPQLNEDGLAQLKATFLPNLVLARDNAICFHQGYHTLADELALILLTSGSTGGGKAVALSRTNIEENTRSICQYLPIQKSDITLATMPFSYSYGLSVLNTHLATGACVAITSSTVMDKGFWESLERLPVTSIAGVPHWYDMLIRLRFTRRDLPDLRYFTQAGGRLSDQAIQVLVEFADRNNSQFFRMYGQTEATARIAWLDPSRADKPGAIGRAIPGGNLFIEDESHNRIVKPGEVGELCYTGPNCMLGYVGHVSELSAFEPYEILRTGDLAYLDEDRDFRICGRKKRIIKLMGERLNLDGLESMYAAEQLNVKCIGDDSKLIICCFEADLQTVKKFARKWLSCPPKFYCVEVVRDWPLLENGKTDYRYLASTVKSATFG